MAKKIEETTTKTINRLSIQMSPEQKILLKKYIGKNFSETGIILTSSFVMRMALQEFLKKNLLEEN